MSGRSGRGYAQLREALSAATLRAILGLREAGQVFLARVGTPTNGEPVDTTGGADVFVQVLDALTELPVLGRLFIPANILWHKPRAGETVMVVEGRGASAPGAPYVLHGDAGGASAVPPWFATKSGIYSPGVVVVQSSDGDVEVECPGGSHVKLGASATKGVNRQGDTTDNGTLLFTPNVGMAPAVLVFVPPGGVVPVVVPPTVAIPLSGITGPGSAKIKAED